MSASDVIKIHGAGQDLRARFSRDWFVVPGEQIYEKLRMKPLDVPGVRALPKGLSLSRPWPYEVHRTHAPILGLTVESTGTSATPPKILRPYQHVSWNFIRERRGTLLADEQRVGKTAPTLFSHDDDDRDPLFVMGPLAARIVWHEWAARRWGGCTHQLEYQRKEISKPCPICTRIGVSASDVPSFLVCEGRTLNVERVLKYKPRVLFATYAVGPTWKALAAHLKHIGTFVLDEIHLAGVQNRKNLTVEAMTWLNTIALRVVAVTGTPLFNRVQGLWPILNIAAPAAFGDYWDFARRYCGARPGAHGWVADGETHSEELKKRLTEIMIRRRWTDIQQELPPITRSLELIPLPNSVKDAVENEASRVRYETRSMKTFVGDLARLRKLYANQKIDGAVNVISQILADGHSCIAWAWHRETAHKMAEALEAKGIPVYGPLVGDTSPTKREVLLADVEKETRPRVLVASIAALATAVTLAWATHEVFVELSWNPSDIAQAEMRPYNGSNRVSAIYLAADVDVDTRLAQALISKLETQGRLGLKAGVGDVSEMLASSLGVERDRSLDDLASQLLATTEDWV